MSDDPKPTGGGDPNDPAGNPDDSGNKSEVEALRAHADKLLSEKKKEQAKRVELEKRLQEIEDEKKKKTEEDLKEQNKWKEYAETKEKELKDTLAKLQQHDIERADSIKYNACLKNLDGSVDSAYWHLFDIDKIKTHPETGELDESSVKEVVESFRQTHARLIDKPGSGNPNRLPNNAPIDDPNSTSIEDWKKLPLKEKKARMAAVYAANKDKL